ncbi:MAG TPA: site-2 protease family protein [Candidatus Binataceae bacterium]|nr:site-2 protease family protein [Candidatus Binataceae bacterium]
MDDFSAHSNVSPVLTDIPRFEHHAEPISVQRERARQPVRIGPLNVALFLLTMLTTTMAGAYAAGAPVELGVPASLTNLAAGLSFSIPMMLILFAHEMGHYLTARRYGIDSSLPYFLPAPYPSLFFVGTFGAFIRMRAPARTRREMFDIGAAGPWAGFVVALAAIVIGLTRSQVTPLDTSQGGMFLGNSMSFWLISRVVLGVDPNTVNVNLHPIAVAGWLGLLVTAINLLPVGQLDGGHVVYSLLGGRLHRVVSRLAWIGCGLMVVVPYLFHLNFWAGWLLWFVLLIVLGLGHPATMDTEMPLRGSRKLAAWATIGLFIVTFTPVPIMLIPPSGLPPGQNHGQSYSVIHHGGAANRALHWPISRT